MTDINKMKEIINLIREAVSIYTSYIGDYSLEKLFSHSEALMTYSKFKVGQEVYLNYSPTISENINYGWYGYRNILIKGTKGIIHSIDYKNNSFVYSVKIATGLFSFKENKLNGEQDESMSSL